MHSSDLKLIILTGIATFLASLAVVYLGLRRERLTRDRQSRARHSGYLRGRAKEGEFLLVGEQLIYDIRDWSYMLQYYYRDKVLRLDHHRHHPGVETLRYLMANDSFPQSIQPSILLLVDYSSALNAAFASGATVHPAQMTDEARVTMARLAEATDDIAQDIVHGTYLRDQLAQEFESPLASLIRHHTGGER